MRGHTNYNTGILGEMCTKSWGGGAIHVEAYGRAAYAGMALWHLARMQSRKCHGRSAAPTVITKSIFTRVASKEQEDTCVERIMFISMSIREAGRSSKYQYS